MAAQVADRRDLLIASADVELDGPQLAVRRPHPHDHAQRLASLASFAKRVFCARTIVRVNDIEERLLLQVREVPAQKLLLGGARFDPVEADRLEPIHHVRGREFARRVRGHEFAGVRRRIDTARSGSSGHSGRAAVSTAGLGAVGLSGVGFSALACGLRRPRQRRDCMGQLRELRRRW